MRCRLARHCRPALSALTVLLICLLPLPAPAAQPTDDVLRQWTQKVEPLLERHCTKCHGGVRQRGDLDIRSLERLLHGGSQGPALLPGRPDESLLYQYVLVDAEPHMPPDDGQQLTHEEIAALRSWMAALPSPADLGIALTSESDRAGFAKAYTAELQKRRAPQWVPQAERSLTENIDAAIALAAERRQIALAPVCDDSAFVRRIYLDLWGRIPSRAERDEFLADQRSEKRAALIDRLLESTEHATRMRDVFDVVLMDRKGPDAEERRRRHGWYDYLERIFRTNRAWDQVVRELVEARPIAPEDRGAQWFLYERNGNFQAVAEALGPLAYGLQIQCAQCHNHPLSWEVEQRHYWALAAAFGRSKNVDVKGGVGVAESAVGGFMNFSNLKKESQPALLVFVHGQAVTEPRPGEDQKEADAPDLYEVPPAGDKQKPEHPSVPKYSRRRETAQALTRSNPLLPRAFVNRIWALLLGRGLVHPVDQMDSKHPASHPELLDLLATDFERHGYDVRRLIRQIVLTQAYQRDSRCGASGSSTSLPPIDSFARGLDKPLSAEQLFRSVLVATGNTIGPDGRVRERNSQDVRRVVVARFPELFADQYNATAAQSLFLTNSPLLEELFRPSDDNTAARLVKIESRDERIQQAFLAVLGREADGDERQAFTAVLESRSPEAGVELMLGALVASAEFLINH